MKTSLTEKSVASSLPNSAGKQRFFPAAIPRPGSDSGHTVYGGAHLSIPDSQRGWVLSRSVHWISFAPDFLMFAKAIGLTGAENC